jgi:hypothetical protein
VRSSHATRLLCVLATADLSVPSYRASGISGAAPDGSVDRPLVCADNLLVIDVARWSLHLPSSIEAIVLTPNSSPVDVAHAHELRTEIVSEYALTYEQAPPIVVYDPDSSPTAPFRRP